MHIQSWKDTEAIFIGYQTSYSLYFVCIKHSPPPSIEHITSCRRVSISSHLLPYWLPSHRWRTTEPINPPKKKKKKLILSADISELKRACKKSRAFYWFLYVMSLNNNSRYLCWRDKNCKHTRVEVGEWLCSDIIHLKKSQGYTYCETY